MNNTQKNMENLLWGFGCLVAVINALLPVVWIISLSLKRAADLNDRLFIPVSVSFDNYRVIFTDSQFPAALWNSIGIALIATLLSVSLAMSAAYAIVRLEFPGKKAVLAGALAIAMFPPVSIIGPLFNLWRYIGLFDTWAGLILPYMTFTLPLAIWTLSAFFREIPWDLDKAARVDGATPFQAFRYVIAPLAVPGVFTSAILVFIFAWNDFLFATALTSTNGPRRHCLLYRQFPVRRAHRRHRRRLGSGDDTHHHRGPFVPAAHRFRSHCRRGQRLGEEMTEIILDHVSKRFPDGTVTLKEASFTVHDGEFFILVGPSGCGKSTLLNMIAGLEEVSAGEIRVDGRAVNNLDPKDRNMAMVFQSYAIYPHMSVRGNLAFPLRLAKLPKAEIARRVNETAAILELIPLLDRKPASLSGGQRQRVAMGRAIVREPKAFLLDEPLSNLDARLRVQMRTGIARLQKRLNTTMIYDTHDQTEAMTLGDRVAVMNRGEVQQIGTPRELYCHPANLFVAGFIGSSGYESPAGPNHSVPADFAFRGNRIAGGGEAAFARRLLPDRRRYSSRALKPSRIRQRPRRSAHLRCRHRSSGMAGR